MWTLPDFLKFRDPALSEPVKQPMLTPCIGICELAADGFCEGCHRTGAEIGRWTSMSDFERKLLMDEILPARELKRSGA